DLRPSQARKPDVLPVAFRGAKGDNLLSHSDLLTRQRRLRFGVVGVGRFALGDDGRLGRRARRAETLAAGEVVFVPFVEELEALFGFARFSTVVDDHLFAAHDLVSKSLDDYRYSLSDTP